MWNVSLHRSIRNLQWSDSDEHKKFSYVGLWLQAEVLRRRFNVRDEVKCGRQDVRYRPSIPTTLEIARHGPETIAAATLAEEAAV